MQEQEIDDPYVLLGVSQTATAQQIKNAYRTRIKRCHPDLGSEPGRVEAFKRLTGAYHLLTDPVARALHDQETGVSNDTPPPPREPAAPARAAAREEDARQVAEMLEAGQSRLAVGAFGEAEDLARLALHRDRRNADAYVLLAAALADTARYTEAIGCLTLALHMDPEHAAARQALERLRNRDEGRVAHQVR